MGKSRISLEEIARRQTPQNILLIENKDTFYSMRRHLISGVAEILGCRWIP